MTEILSSMQFFAQFSVGNYYGKNIHPQTGSDLANILCALTVYVACYTG
jgi:hypothetical protein